MPDRDKVESLLKLADFSWRDYSERRSIEWRTNFTLWLTLGTFAGFILDTLAPQLGVTVESVSAIARCEADFRGAVGMDGTVPDLQNIVIDMFVQSPDSESQVQKLYEASQQRCPIYLALIKGMPVKTSLETKSV